MPTAKVRCGWRERPLHPLPRQRCPAAPVPPITSRPGCVPDPLAVLVPLLGGAGGRRAAAKSGPAESFHMRAGEEASTSLFHGAELRTLRLRRDAVRCYDRCGGNMPAACRRFRQRNPQHGQTNV